jgi:hypothetical protein
MPRATGVADSGCCAGIDPRHPKVCRFPSTTIYSLGPTSSQQWFYCLYAVWRTQDGPEAVSFGKIGEDAVPEVFVLAAVEEDVGDGLPPLSAAAAGAG